MRSYLFLYSNRHHDSWDYKLFLYILQGAKQRMTELEKKGKSLMQARQIKKYDPDFATKQFAELALNIYTEAQELLTE